MNNKTVIVGMSGGVDSSVAAYLLKKQGYNVIGVTMDTTVAGANEENVNNTINDAKNVAKMLGISHYVLDFRDIFKKNVVDYFIEEYKNARTPNPCNVCNRFVKWQALLDRFEEFGADYVATGHYARIDKLSNGRYAIKNSITADKDQTYALYNLTQEQLSKTIMPVGEYTKDKIREIAKEIGLNVAEKPDSQDICFIPDKDYIAFIQKHGNFVPEEGNFVTTEGKIVGTHKGITNYTIGQRKGLGIAMGHPVFVTKIDKNSNEVVLGENEDLFTDVVYVKDFNFMAIDSCDETKELLGKIRYSHKGTKCRLKQVDENVYECKFEEKVRAATPGQALVLYEGEYVAGGGIII
ncbi:MAG: tRNA 2-thiouridine(34) synthase MnmA [Lachnospiraceae bacterium]|nr:tRNA 2-thiouridine(34) synthase MnmA [Lachnospiraceae bacterium]